MTRQSCGIMLFPMDLKMKMYIIFMFMNLKLNKVKLIIKEMESLILSHLKLGD